MDSRIKNFTSDWMYNSDLEKRDLRIDYIRGIVMWILIVVHLEFQSIYNMFLSERIGVISGGEGFVILSGVVVGMVYSGYLERRGWKRTITKLVDRSVQLYVTNIAVIIAIAAVSFFTFINTSSVTTYVDKSGGQVWPLYNMPVLDTMNVKQYASRFDKTNVNAKINNIYYYDNKGKKQAVVDNTQQLVAKALLLRMGPHQFQIMGLYVVLLLVSPLALFLLANKRTGILLGLSLVLYLKNWIYPITGFPPGITGAQFENAFSLLTWQFIFFLGMSVGYHKEKIKDIMQSNWRKPILYTAWILFIIFFLFAQNNPDPNKIQIVQLQFISADTFADLYHKYFQKNQLGVLRLVNYFAVLIVLYYMLTRYWKFFNKALGWFLIPLGQASLYVFTIHIFLILIFNQIDILWMNNIWMNTVLHTIVLAVTWLMVKYKVLFNIIPR